MKKVLSLVLSLVIVVGMFSNVPITVGAEDSSVLTPNQYMSKVILNHNYTGVLNEYGALSRTPQQGVFEDIYYNPVRASSARIIYDEFKNAEDFQTINGLYELLTFDLSNASSQIMKLEDYYTTIILSVIDAKFADDNFIDSVNCTTNKNIVMLTKSVTNILKTNASYDLSNLSSIPMTMLTDEEADYILDEIINSANHKNLYTLVGKNISLISDIMYAANSVSDAIKNICAYTSIADTSVAIENVLYEIYLKCPSDNAPLKTASSQVYRYVSEEMSYQTLSMITASEAAMEVGTKILLSSVWSACLEGMFGHISVGIMIGQAVGKAISNFCFGTDAKLEQLVVIGCLVNFEDVMVSAVKSLAGAYKNNPNESNADNYIKSLELLLSTYNLGHIYGSDFMTLVYTEGVISSIKYSGSGDLQDWLDISNERQANMPWHFIRFSHYAPFYKEDVSNGYDIYFGGDEGDVAVTGIYFAYNYYELAMNQTFEMQATVSPANATNTSLTYSSSNTNVITVESNGTITPIGEGTANVIATASNGVKGTCKITVYPYDVSENDTGYTIDKYLGSETEVLIPSSINGIKISIIDDNAFHYCTNLTSIDVDEYNDYYTSDDGVLFNKNKTNLVAYPIGKTNTRYSIPDSVTTIGNFAFAGCKRLESITIPSNVTSIGYNAFGGCAKLSNISIPDSVLEIGSYCFEDCKGLKKIILPNSVKNIGNSVFAGCLSLESATLPKTVENVGSGVFADCISLESVVLPDNITELNTDLRQVNADGFALPCSGFFSNCQSLKNIVIPDSVTSLGMFCFSGCVSLETINLPASVTEIDSSAFEWMAIDSINVDENNLSFSSEDGVLFNKDKTTLVKFPEGKGGSYKIPNSVKKLEQHSFYYCGALTSLELPQNQISYNLISFDSSPFLGCSGLTDIIRRKSNFSGLFSSGWKGIKNDCQNLRTVICLDEFTPEEEYNAIFAYKFDSYDLDKRIFIIDELGLKNLDDYVVNVDLELKPSSGRYYGTGSKIKSVDNEYTLIVRNDINGDSVCDVLDCAQAALVVNGHRTIDGAYAMAADSNSDDIVDINDYQAIVNKALVS